MTAKGNSKSEHTALRLKVAALQKRIELLEQVIDNFPGGIVLTDKEHNILICNRYQRDAQEYPDSLFKNRRLKLKDLFRFNAMQGEYGPCNVDQLIADKMELVAKREPHYYERARPNGHVVEVRGVPLNKGGFVTCYTDVTENRRHQALIADLALTDPLTSLANRRLLQDRFEQTNARAKRGEDFALHYIDLDHFKPVNDKFGHKAGDAVLLEVAHRLQAATRETDTVARIGGDEFVILQCGARTEKTATLLANRLISAISEPIHHDGHALGVTASIGIAFSIGGQHSLDEMLRHADQALYQSKKNGRNRAGLFEDIGNTPQMRGAA